MHRINDGARLWIVMGMSSVILLATLPAANTRVHAGVAATPTPYHEGITGGAATPHAMAPSLYPLPGAEDRATADAMAAGGAAMIQMAQVMDEAASFMLGTADPHLVALAEHWVLDAQALRQQAAWMVLSATAADMVHDPAKAHEINVSNLNGNGLAMSAEGEAMAEHGQEMVAHGETLQREGQRMQDFAADMLAVIGG